MTLEKTDYSEDEAWRSIEEYIHKLKSTAYVMSNDLRHAWPFCEQREGMQIEAKIQEILRLAEHRKQRHEQILDLKISKAIEVPQAVTPGQGSAPVDDLPFDGPAEGQLE